MAMISLGEAATQFGLSAEVIEEWAKKGLIQVHTDFCPGYFPPAWVDEQQVDEDEFAHFVESLGWLQLSAEN